MQTYLHTEALGQTGGTEVGAWRGDGTVQDAGRSKEGMIGDREKEGREETETKHCLAYLSGTDQPEDIANIAVFAFHLAM